jgi:hypothetical protein
MNEDKAKRLNLMRFWLFGTFVIVWAATFTFTYLWTAPASASIMDVVKVALPIWIITAVLAVVWYLGYKWWLGRDEGAMAPAAPDLAAPPPPAMAEPPAAPPESPSYSQSSEGGSEG